MSKAYQFALEQEKHFKNKAKHNKCESLWCFRLIMLCTLIAPLFVSLTDDFWLSKVLPSVMSAFAAFCTAWLQLRKPQELWSMYRTSERDIEFQITQYNFKSGCYVDLDEENADRLLAENVSKVKYETHLRWVSKVPNNDSLSNSV